MYDLDSTNKNQPTKQQNKANPYLTCNSLYK